MVKFPSYPELKQEISNTTTIDSNFTNDEINSEIVVKGIDIDNFSMKDFRKQVIAQAKERANRKEETKDQDKKNKLKKKK